MPAPLALDLDRLALHLRSRMEEEGLSLRRAAEEIGVSPGTMSRLLQGVKSPNVPDSANVLRALTWLGRTFADFSGTSAKPSSSLADVEMHLRALPGLKKAEAEGLVAMVKAVYAYAQSQEKKSNR